MSLLNTVKKFCQQVIMQCFVYEVINIPSNFIEITIATKKKFGHYQCNSAMKLAKMLKQPPIEIAQRIQQALIKYDTSVPALFYKVDIAGAGFINLTLTKAFLTSCINEHLRDPRQMISLVEVPKKVILDFSSPNIAKEMHVGHLCSIIIGDCLARILTFLGHDVLRLNHIGDWGTQFGMLLAYMKRKKMIRTIEKLELHELAEYYKKAKVLYDENIQFKLDSQEEVVKLQSGDPASKAIWQQICSVSRKAYRTIYKLLGVELIERGESFYQKMLPDIIKSFEGKNLVHISQKAKCIYLSDYTNRDGEILPLIVQKSDGAYNYATTDLAAIAHRIQMEKGNWLIYVTDLGQSLHFKMIFEASKFMNCYRESNVELSHVPFGLVLRNDGKKIKTRMGDTERLIDLITTAINKSKILLRKRNPNLGYEELEKMGKQLGINAIKYADLSNHRTSNYIFSYEKMLKFDGNTAAFLSYAYVRIHSIKRKIGIPIEELKCKTSIQLFEDAEIDLALFVCQFSDALENTISKLLPNRLADYLYGLAEKFHVFFHQCRVAGVPQQNSRLLLCEAVSLVLKRGFFLLGLTPLIKM